MLFLPIFTEKQNKIDFSRILPTMLIPNRAEDFKESLDHYIYEDV